MNKIIGSPRFKLAMSDLGHMLNVALFVAGSAFATKMVELLSNYDFGKYQIVAMGVINLLAVGAQQFFKDTQVEIIQDENPSS